MLTEPDIAALEPGDVAILVGKSGNWLGPYEFVRVDPDCPERLLMRGPDGGSFYSVRADLVRLPVTLGANAGPGDAPPESESERPVQQKPAAKITAAQRRAIFGLAKGRGLDIEGLRALTPAGSISSLTRLEAAELLDRLKGSHSGDVHEGRGTATPLQRTTIAALQSQIGFTDSEFSAWLANKFKVASAAAIADKGLASRVIGGMLRMRANLVKRQGECPAARTTRPRSKRKSPGQSAPRRTVREG